MIAIGVLLLAWAAPEPAVSTASTPQIVLEAVGPFGEARIEEIITMNLDGSRRAQRTNDGMNKFLPHFSPDGSRILYTKFLRGAYGDPTSVTAVAVFDLASERETLVTPTPPPGGAPLPPTGTPWQPIWSPDGKRIAFGTGDGLWIMNADGSDAHRIGGPAGTEDDFVWGDPLWSREDWIYFVVAQNVAGCFKTRTDRIRPDGSARTKISDGGPNCTPPGFEQNGDADPGISPDGKTIYSSRGLPRRVPGRENTVRHLVAFAAEPWTPGKVEVDLSLDSKPDCVAGVPKVSPDGSRILLFLFCGDDTASAGVTLTDTRGSFWAPLGPGFGPDWNPAYENVRPRPSPPVRPGPRPRGLPPR
jgi:dipeptidyl aminopeptidase/acylaminoacyl peptidase